MMGRIKPPMCPRCHVATTQLHEIPASDFRPGRAYFECPSCFVISQAPVTYEIKNESRPKEVLVGTPRR